MVCKCGWPINQVNFVGRNFYLIVFSIEEHREEALHIAPWYMEHKFMYTISWEPAFDVLSHFNMLPIWIDLLFRAIALDTSCKSLAKSLRKLLVYLRVENTSNTQMTMPIYYGT